MKLSVAFISVVLSASPFIAACGRDSSPAHVDAASSGSTLESTAKGVSDSAKDALAKGKDEWRKFVDANMPEVDRRIAELKDGAAKATGSAKVELDKLAQDVGEKRQVLQQKLDELKTASSAQWQSSRADIDRALGDLRQSIDHALDKTK
jgi:DNA-binding transcriptional MerR regulator